MLGLICPSTFVLLGGYLYVAVAITRAELKAKAEWSVALGKALVWPTTIWSTIEKLYEV